MTTTPIGIHATAPAALPVPPRPQYRATTKHVALAVDQIGEELDLNWSGSQRDDHYRDLFERIHERAEEIARADFEHAKPEPTKYVGLAIDACALLQEIQTLVARVNWFESGAVALSELQDAAHRATPILAKLRSAK
jgi:hypothetical protein